ncbi:hypothetical protein B14911_23027 [Bacillus sp. NRRL B-14911]|nr:hypothetical protein B14911_23027 [Bacillus sp. NRRL B-14911]
MSGDIYKFFYVGAAIFSMRKSL